MEAAAFRDGRRLWEFVLELAIELKVLVTADLKFGFGRPESSA